jgi:hypothetical protein
MCESLYSAAIGVLIPLRWAARRARCSMFSIVRHVVGLMRFKMGAAYVYFVLSNVLYRSSATYGGS